MATRLIATQAFDYYAFDCRTPNAIGLDVAVYKTPVTLRGSIQPVPRSLYQAYGLDFQKNYINVYVSQAITDISRDVSGDQIVFEGNPYQCVSKTPWVGIDGWDAVLCVAITKDAAFACSRR
ncbi:phage collar protein [Singulisphaera rosea]